MTKIEISNTYYIDSNQGDDNNSGISPDLAWKTLDKINKTTFIPGDQIFFKANCKWLGQLHPKGSGNEKKPIIINMYGEGNKPIIDGNGSSGEGDGAVILLYNQNYWEIYNLEITNKFITEAPRFGILIRWHDYGTGEHIYVRDCYIHDINGALKGRFNGDAIIVICTGHETPTNFNNVKIEKNIIKNVVRTGISIWSAWAERLKMGYSGDSFHATNGKGIYLPSTNCVIRNNFLDSCTGDGILVSVCTNPLIEYNIVKNSNCVHSGEANVGIWPHNSDGALIQFNESYETKQTLDGQGFDVDMACNSAVVQYNYSHDNIGGFILVCAFEENSTIDTIIRYNISENDHNSLFSFVGKIVNTNVYNNVFYMDENTGEINIINAWNWGGYDPDYSILKNNVFYNKSIYSNFTLTASTNNIFENNSIYGNIPDNLIKGENKILPDSDYSEAAFPDFGEQSEKFKAFIKASKSNQVMCIKIYSQNDCSENIIVGDTVQFGVYIIPFKSINDSISWSVSNESIASINKNGLLVAKTSGKFKVKATYLSDKTINDEVEVIIK